MNSMARSVLLTISSADTLDVCKSGEGVRLGSNSVLVLSKLVSGVPLWSDDSPGDMLHCDAW